MWRYHSSTHRATPNRQARAVAAAGLATAKKGHFRHTGGFADECARMRRRACSRLSSDYAANWRLSQKAAGQILKGHDSEVMCLAFAKSGRRLLSGSSPKITVPLVCA